MANFNSKNIMLVGLKGEETAISQDLTADGFTPVANTYYKHTGVTSANFTNGIIYLYDGTEYKAIDGSGGGGSSTVFHFLSEDE